MSRSDTDPGSPSPPKVLLLAAGFGTRLRPLTETLPKCLVPVAGRALLDYWFDAFAAAGIRDVVINSHYLHEQVEAYVAAINETGDFSVRVSYEPELLGSAGTVTANRDLVDDGSDCVIVYADNLSDVDIGALIASHRSHDDPFTMMLFETPYPKSCGIAKLDSKDRIVEFVEKPENPASNLANAGVYVVSARAYREIADMNRFDLGYEVIPQFVDRMRGWVWKGYHRDIGTLESLRQAEADFASKEFDPRSHDNASSSERRM